MPIVVLIGEEEVVHILCIAILSLQLAILSHRE